MPNKYQLAFVDASCRLARAGGFESGKKKVQKNRTIMVSGDFLNDLLRMATFATTSSQHHGAY